MPRRSRKRCLITSSFIATVMTDNSSERKQSFPSQTSEPQVSNELASAIQQALMREASDDAVERLRLAAEQLPQMVSAPIPLPKWTWASKITLAAAACLAGMIVLVVAIRNDGLPQTQPQPSEIETVVETEPTIQPSRRSTQVTLVSTTYQRLLDDLNAVESRVDECSESLSLAEVHRDIQDTLHEFRQWPHRHFDKKKENSK